MLAPILKKVYSSKVYERARGFFNLDGFIVYYNFLASLPLKMVENGF
jgi:hypothetical protein